MAPATAGTARVNRTTGRHVQDGADDEEAQALRAEGFDPDDPDVRAAVDLVRWEGLGGEFRMS